MEILQPQIPETNIDVEKNIASAHYSCTRSWVLTLFVLTIFFGFIGGLCAPLAMTFLRERTAYFAGNEKNYEMNQVVKTNTISEDELITNLVEKNSTGVVSIIISKDVPKVRSFFGDPSQGFPFFSPFSVPQKTPQNDTQNGNSATEKQKIGSGSGFFVSADGLIITNKHVVADEQADYTVIANGGKEYPAKVLARDPSNDIAILKIEGKDFPALSLGNSDQIKVGQTVIAIGNPLGEFADSVTRGIVSGLKRSVSAGSRLGMEERLTDIIQTDAAINPGNSGGPLFDISGDVVGINVAMAQGAENIGFALPINQVKRIIEQVSTTGKLSTPYIGVRYIILNDAIQKENSLPYNYGALILRGQTMTDFAVIPGSPADKAGLVENDIILEVNGAKIDESHPLSNAISQNNVGDEITLKVWHKGKEGAIKVKLEERK
jgi:serine protease Do